MNGPVTLAVVVGLSILVAVACCLLVLRGRARAAWSVPAGVGLVAVALTAIVTVVDTYGQAGLAVFLMLMLFFLPLLAGGVLGCLAGHLAHASRRGGSGDGRR